MPLRDKLHATLPSVTRLRNAGKIRCSLTRIVAKSRTDFYYYDCGNKKVAGHVHFRVCYTGQVFVQFFIATKLQDKLQKRLPSATAPLNVRSTLHASLQVDSDVKSEDSVSCAGRRTPSRTSRTLRRSTGACPRASPFLSPGPRKQHVLQN